MDINLLKHAFNLTNIDQKYWDGIEFCFRNGLEKYLTLNKKQIRAKLLKIRKAKLSAMKKSFMPE